MEKTKRKNKFISFFLVLLTVLGTLVGGVVYAQASGNVATKWENGTFMQGSYGTSKNHATTYNVDVANVKKGLTSILSGTGLDFVRNGNHHTPPLTVDGVSAFCRNPLFMNAKKYTRKITVYTKSGLIDNRADFDSFLNTLTEYNYPDADSVYYPDALKENGGEQAKMGSRTLLGFHLIRNTAQRNRDAATKMLQDSGTGLTINEALSDDVMIELSWMYSADAYVVRRFGGYLSFPNLPNSLLNKIASFGAYVQTNLDNGKIKVRDLQYNMFTIPPSDPKYDYYNTKNTSYQVLGQFLGYLEFNDEYNLSLLKTGKNKSLTDINKAGYSLNGAKYNVYKTKADAEQSRNEIGTLTTDAQGNTNSLKLKVGNYFVKEVYAPKGFKLDRTVYPVSLKDKDVKLSVSDSPKFDPLNIMIKKADDHSKPVVGAEFEVKYYPGELTLEQAKGTAAKTWKFKTGSLGRFAFKEYDEKNGGRISGDELWMIDGFPQGLIGTYVFKETKAPDGYALDTKEYVAHVKDEGTTKITTIYQEPTSTDETQKMRFELRKRDFMMDSANNVGMDRSLDDATYNVILREKGYEHDANNVGDVVATLKTKNGVAQSPELQLGSYDIVEVDPSTGYIVNPVAINVIGAPDSSGNRLTGNVQQRTGNADALIGLYNKKVEEYQAVIKGTSSDKVLEKVEPLANPMEKAENAKVIADETPVFGRISLMKMEETGVSDNSPAPNQFLPEANVEFNVLYNGEVVDTIKTNQNGRGYSKFLPAGKYTIHQVTHTEGLIDVSDFDATIENDEAKNFAEYTYILENYANREYLKIVKMDEETNETILQAGVTFKLYDKNGNQIKQIVYNPEYEEVDEFVTDDKGMVQLPKKIKVGTYYIDEIKAPEGYYIGDPHEKVKVEIPDDNSKVATVFIREVQNTPQKGQLTINKTGPKLVGYEEKQVENENYKIVEPKFEDGGIAGTKWQLIAEKDIMSYDKQTKLLSKGDVASEFVTGDDGVGLSSEVPLGKYILREVDTPNKYLLDKNEYHVEFTPQVQNIRVDSQTENKYNERKELKFEFDKTFETTKFFKYGYNALFGLYNEEDYVENGVTIPKGSLIDVVRLNTESVHLENPVGGEDAIATDPETKIVTRYEVFGYKTDDQVEVVVEHKQFNSKEEAEAFINEKNAVQEDEDENLVRYELKEITTEVQEEVTNPDNSTNAKIHGAFKNLWMDGKFIVKEIETDDAYRLSEDELKIKYEFGKEEEKETSIAAGEIHNELKRMNLVISKVEMTGTDEKIPLEGVRYKLVAVDPDKGETTVGEYLTNKDGKIRVENLPYGKYYFQEVKSIEGYIKDDSKHDFDASNTADGKDLNVEKENEKIPEIKTQNYAGDETNDKNKVVDPLEMVYINDYVYYSHLIVGKEYEVVGRLMFKDTSDPVMVDGKPVEKAVRFTATEREANVLVQFEVPGSILRGRETVAFETLYREGRELVSHADLNDVPQTFRTTNPEIGTQLFQINGDDKELANGAAKNEKLFFVGQKVNLQDVVSVKDLIEGNEYVLKAKLMLKSSNKQFGDTVELKFVYNGESEIVVNIPEFEILEEIKGDSLVAFEQLYRIDKTGKEHLIAAHEDINDEGQTVRVVNPEVKTQFADVEGDKEVNPTGVVKFVDHVSYKDVIVGKEYTAKLTVMNKETNAPLVDKDGNPYVAETTFVAEKTEGTVEVSVDIDVKDLRGKEIVAFEKLEYKGIEVAAHEDINDEGQTVKITNPEIGTKAEYKDGSKSVTWGEKVTIVDKVEYKDLVPGKTYTMVGEIILRGKDASSDKVITEKVYKEFVPETKDGIVELEFAVDTSKFENADFELVAFEELYFGNEKEVKEGKGVLISEHKDRDDKNQTVNVVKKPEEPRTGIELKDNNVVLYGACFAGVVAIAAVSIYMFLKKKKNNNDAGNNDSDSE